MINIIQLTTWFIIILYSLYVFVKVLHLPKPNIMECVYGVVFSILLAYCVFIIKEQLPYSRFALMIFSIVGFSSIITKTKLNLSLPTSIISIGISYGLYLISGFVSSVCIHFIFGEARYVPITILTIILQTFSVTLLFRVRRLSEGMSFLRKKGLGATGCILSGVIILIYILLNRGNSLESVIWLLLGVVLCVIGIIVWWRRGLTKHYREKIKERNIQELETIISKKDLKIKKLQKDNETMANLIHRDNKLIPALSNAVVHYMENSSDTLIDGEALFNQIQQLAEERLRVLQNRRYDNLPLLINPAVDGLIRQMIIKASGVGARLEVELKDNFSGFNELEIPSLKLQTILADLIENAINATNHSENKKIMVTFDNTNGINELNVQDSGTAFKTETLVNLGIKKVTTRQNEGGSGIGYITIFEILKDCKANIIINEYKDDKLPYTKSIVIRFNRMFGYDLVTYRIEEVKRELEKSNQKNSYLSILPSIHSL